VSETEEPTSNDYFEPSTGGSIESTLAGDADLDIAGVFSEAWALSSNVRVIVLLSGVVSVLIAILVSGVLDLVFGISDGSAGEQLTQWVTNLLIYPLWVGIAMVCIRHSVGQAVEMNMVFNYYHAIVPIAVIYVLQSIAVVFGMILLILPGIYLAIALSLALPLYVDKGLSVGESLKTSLLIINNKFWPVAILAIGSWLLAILGIVTIIGWIWTIPWMVMIYAVTYRQLAGVSTGEQAGYGED